MNQDFRDSEGNNLLIFIDEIVLSKDGKMATVFLTNFSKQNNLSEKESLRLIDDNLIKVKKEFSEKVVLGVSFACVWSNFQFQGFRF